MSPPQANTGATDRSDSSGLVEGDPDVWETAPEPPAPAAPAGAPPAPSAEAPAGSANVPLIVPVVLGGVPGTAAQRDRDRDRDRAEREQQVAAVAGEGEDRDDPAFLPPLTMPGTTDRRRREERSDAGELLSEPDATWDRTPPVDQDLPPDYVALVRESDDDFSSWDADPLPWVSDQATAPAGEDDPGSWGVPAAEDEAGPPPSPEPAAPPPVRPRPAGQSFEAALLREMPVRAGGPDLTAEELQELAERRAEQERQERIRLGLEKDGDGDEDEQAERRAADLLDRDDTQWNRRDDSTVGGVIE